MNHREHRDHREERDGLTGRVIGCAMEVHRSLGPGLLESAYQHCLAKELSVQGIDFQIQVPLAVDYKGTRIDCAFRIDVLVQQRLILELKSVEAISAIHEAQLLTYMKLSGIRTGLLLNFNVRLLKEGIKRFKL